MSIKDTLPAPLRRAVGGSLRRNRSRARWLLFDLPRRPGLELYAAPKGLRIKRRFRRMRRESFANQEAWLAPHYARQVPKTLWMFWAQGLDQAPAVVHRCVETWRRRNPGWDIRVLDEESAAAFADVSDLPAGLPFHVKADLLRVRLLARHGGVWADACTYCHRPLDDWLPLHAKSGFFVFGRTLPTRWMDSGFIAAEANGKLITLWADAYGRYVTRAAEGTRHYFMFNYAFQWAVRTDAEAREEWRRCATIPAQPNFVLMSWIKGQSPKEAVLGLLEAGQPISHLTYKTDVPDQEVAAMPDAAWRAASEAARTTAEANSLDAAARRFEQALVEIACR